MELLRGCNAMRAWRASQTAGRIGFVPTMGALHAGHIALIEEAVKSSDAVVVSLFVNPTQFNDLNDCAKYPQPIDADLEACRAAGVKAVFLPTYADMYPDNYRYVVTEREQSLPMEGAHRPGHFDGVLTVVLKLLLLVRADVAVFGEKDWQQMSLVRDMAAAFFLDTEIRSLPTIREADGLAMSSRNVRLGPAARRLAAEFARALRECSTSEEAVRRLENSGFVVEYIEETDGRRLGAVVLDGVRLIDNIALSEVAAKER